MIELDKNAGAPDMLPRRPAKDVVGVVARAAAALLCGAGVQVAVAAPAAHHPVVHHAAVHHAAAHHAVAHHGAVRHAAVRHAPARHPVRHAAHAAAAHRGPARQVAERAAAAPAGPQPPLLAAKDAALPPLLAAANRPLPPLLAAADVAPIPFLAAADARPALPALAAPATVVAAAAPVVASSTAVQAPARPPAARVPAPLVAVTHVAAPPAAPVTVAAVTVPAAATPAPTRMDSMLRFLRERAILNPVGAMADQSTELYSQVRSGAAMLISSAMDLLGVRYKYGGTSVATGFDCSGFTRHVFESVGLALPRVADAQARDPNLLKVRLKDLKPGDLVFFNTLRRTFSHVGIYLGEGMFIHAPRTGETIRVEDMRVHYWMRRFTGARRVPGLDKLTPEQTQAFSRAIQPADEDDPSSVPATDARPPLMSAMSPAPAPAVTARAPAAPLAVRRDEFVPQADAAGAPALR